MNDNMLLIDAGDDLTGFLYAPPSFLDGTARALDLGGTLSEFNTALSEDQADYLALRADWLTVGQDICRAMAAVEADRKATD